MASEEMGPNGKQGQWRAVSEQMEMHRKRGSVEKIAKTKPICFGVSL